MKKTIMPLLLVGFLLLYLSSAVLASRTDGKYTKDSKDATPTPAEPKTAAEFYASAIESFQAGNSNNAETFVKMAISLDSKNVDYHYLLGKIYLYRGAEKNRLEIRNLGVDSPETNYVKRYVRGRDELALAKNEFEIVTKLNPNDAEGWLNLGVCEDNLGEEESAVASYKQAIRMSPYSTVARDANNNLGLVLQAENKADEALAAYESALKIDPTFSPTRINLNKLLAAHPKLKKKMERK